MGHGNPVREERVAREGKSESVRVGREGMWLRQGIISIS